MENITLTVSDEQLWFLRQFAMNQHAGAADNLGTCKPLHLVQTRVERVIHDEGFEGEQRYYNTDTGKHYGTPGDLVQAALGEEASVVPYDEVEYEELRGIQIVNENDYFEAYSIRSVEVVSVVQEWETVAYFFTLAEAKKYKLYQAHNLNHPRTYTVSDGYGNNGDYEPLWDLLMQAGQEVISKLGWRGEKEDV